MGHIDTNKPAKNGTNFLFKGLSDAGSPFLRAVEAVSKEESTRQNALSVMRPQRVRASRVTDPGDRSTADRVGELADFKAPQILSPHEWAKQAHPDLAMKAKLSGFLIDRLDKEYANYIATQRAVGELALGGAQENRLRFVANQRAAKGSEAPKLPGNLGGQLGFAILTGVEETKVARLRELFEISQGLRDGGGKARRGRGRGVEAPPALEKRAFEAIANEEYEHPSIRLLLNFHGLRQQEKKEPSVLDRLKDMVVAERIKLGGEGPVAQVFRDVSATLRPPQRQREGRTLQPLLVGDPRYAGIKGFGGLSETVDTPQGWIAAYTKLATIVAILDPVEKQQKVAFLISNVPSEPDILLELKAGTIDEAQARIMRAFAARKSGAAGQPPAAGAAPAPIVPPQNGAKGNFKLPTFLGE